MCDEEGTANYPSWGCASRHVGFVSVVNFPCRDHMPNQYRSTCKSYPILRVHFFFYELATRLVEALFTLLFSVDP